MAEISDEMLMAYADGALDPANQALVENALKKHPQYREKVDKFRATRNPVRAAFHGDLETSHLGPLINRIRRDGVLPAATVADPPRVVRFSGDVARTKRNRFPQRISAALAASIALLLGAALGWSLHSRPVEMSQLSPRLVSFSNGGLLAQAELQELLEKASSAAPIMAKTVDGGTWRLTTTYTFRSANRLPCRRYEISSETAGRSAGYACRTKEGQWFVHAHATLDTRAPNNRGFVPAAGDGDAALDAAIRAAMDGDVYQANEEAELIARQWTSVDK